MKVCAKRVTLLRFKILCVMYTDVLSHFLGYTGLNFTFEFFIRIPDFGALKRNVTHRVMQKKEAHDTTKTGFAL